MLARLLWHEIGSARGKIRNNDLSNSGNRAGRLRSEIAQLEARYDGLFPPGVYIVLEQLKRELVLLEKVTCPPIQ